MACAAIAASFLAEGGAAVAGSALAGEAAALGIGELVGGGLLAEGAGAALGGSALAGEASALGIGELAGAEAFGGAAGEMSGAGMFGGLESLATASPALFGTPAATAAATAAGPGLSFPSISQLGSGMNIASSLYGMSQAEQLKKLAAIQANKATPWQSAGGGDLASQQLMALISGKTDVTGLPGYKAGEQAVMRQGAANGWLGSGNMMASLSKFGGDFYNQAVSQLSGLSGAQFNPAAGSQLAMTGASNSAALNLAAMSNINKTIETQPAWR